MRIHAGLALAATLAALPATAQEKSVLTSVGYTYLHYTESGEEDSKLGAYLSVASGREGIGLDLDLAYHHNKYEYGNDAFVIHTFTAGLGPRLNLASEGPRPFLHVLGALRHDWTDGSSTTHYGWIGGGGVDVPAGGRLLVRFGGDFEMYFYDGGRVNVVRLTAGLTF
jgi:hypothetical protein